MRKIFLSIFVLVLALPSLSRADEPKAMEIGPSAPPVEGAGDSGANETSQNDYFTGAATHRIEIEVPEGRAGLTPKLVLEYNSHRRDAASLFGFGWDMNPGYIERSTQNNIDYNGRDFVFSAEGQRRPLVYSNRLAPNNCEEYNAKVETGDFIRYFYCGGPTGNHWIAYDKQGVRYTYGSVETARLQDNFVSPRIFRWYLEEIRDLNGNIIQFNYIRRLRIGAYGEVTLESIFYTKHENSSGAIDAAAQFQIRFDYVGGGTSPSLSLYRPVSFSMATGRHLEKIRVEDQNQIVRTYEFVYDDISNTLAPILKAINVTASKGSETIQLPQKTFNYSNLGTRSDPWGTQMQTTIALTGDDLSLYDETHGFFDMNGDGYLDRVVGRPGNHKFSVYYGSPNGPQNVATDWTDKWDQSPLDGAVVADDSYFGFHARIMDMNGDMLPDRVYIGKDIPMRDGSSVSGFIISINTGSEWKWAKIWADPFCSPSYPDRDFFCGYMDSSSLMLQDVTGDGLPDRIRWEDQVLHVYKNLGDRFSDQVEDWTDPIPLQYRGKIFSRDMNGDGLPDRVWADNFYGVGYGFYIYLNNGHGWDTAGYFMPDPNGDSAMGETADLIDINRDGLADRVVGNPSAKTIRVYWNRGWKFETANFLEARDPAWANLSGIINYNGFYPGFMDMDGDGYLDRIVPSGGGGLSMASFRPDKGSGLYLLREMSNGLGVNTKIEYTPASHFINALLSLPLHVITKQTVEEGSETKTTDIRYAGGYFYPDYFNPAGRAFNGFNFVEIRDPLGNIEHRWYYQAWDGGFIGKLLVVPEHMPTDLSSPLPAQEVSPDYHATNSTPWDEISLSGRIYRQNFYFEPRDGRGISKHHEISRNWQLTFPDDIQNPRRYVFLLEEVRSDYEGVGGRITKKNWDYDSLTGNKTLESDDGEVGVDTPHKMVFENFQTLSLPGFGTLTTSRAQTVTAKEGGSILRNRITKVFDPKGNLSSQTELLIDGAAQKNLTTSFTYDSYGNVLTRTNPLNRTTTYTYETVYNMYPQTETVTVSGKQFITRRSFDGTFGKIIYLDPPDRRIQNFFYDPIGR
ncbi:MAG: VCBS repeat-containing protein, partial [Deltaproteobacteria bacterium]|nr:VCBS repeat-containing protein [Deltaproteobacteria bacterium]